MESGKTGWSDVLVQTVKVLLVAFVALVIKEYMDTREWDTRACAIDSSWVAGGTLVVNGILKLLRF